MGYGHEADPAYRRRVRRLWLQLALWTLSVALLVFPIYALLPLRRPRRTESEVFFFRFSDFFYWFRKYLRPMPHPESERLARFFRDQDLSFPPAPERAEQRARLCFAGDIIPGRIFTRRRAPRLYEALRDHVARADCYVGNLEFALTASRGPRPFPFFNPSLEMFDVLTGADGGVPFDLFFTANNHRLDHGFRGICETLDLLDERGIPHTGSARTEEESRRILHRELNGIRFAFLSYTFGLNARPYPAGRDFCVNYVRLNAVDPDDVDRDAIHDRIAQARDEGAEVVVLGLHWGIDLEYWPAARQIPLAEDLFEAGADLIVGHHPHIVQHKQSYLASDGRRCICHYSLGNYATVFTRRVEFTTSELAFFEFARVDGRPRLCDFRVLPLCLLHDREHRLVPVYQTLERIEASGSAGGLSARDVDLLRRTRDYYERVILQDRRILMLDRA